MRHFWNLLVRLLPFLDRERGRQIFRFWDGRKMRGMDPLVAFGGLVNHPKYNSETTPLLAQTGDEEAYRTMLGAARDVFGVQPWSESGGLTEIETMQLMYQFADFMAELKKSGSDGQIAPPSSECEQSPPVSANRTNARSDSGSTLPESNAVAPSPA